jgi:hypothetical protein
MQELIALHPQRSPQPTLERSLTSATDISAIQEQQASGAALTGSIEQPYPSIKLKTFRHRSPLAKPASQPAPQPQPTMARHRDRSPRIEELINRLQRNQSNNLLDDRRQQPRLEYLAVGKREDGRYQIILSGTLEPFVQQIFKTVQHCVEAALELEEVFDLGRLIEGCFTEALETAEAIVLAHAHREQVERELGLDDQDP